MKTEERVLRLENAFSTLVELARTQSERMDDYERRTEELAQTQKELAQAQKELTEEQKRLTGAQTELAESQNRTETNLSALTVIVAELGRATTSLTEKVDKHIGGG